MLQAFGKNVEVAAVLVEIEHQYQLFKFDISLLNSYIYS